jgi:dihydroflavonol-4-reductase
VSPVKLVIGASGFLGSHVARQLVADGESVRVMVRPTSSTRAIDDIDVEVHHGDIFDVAALQSAMTGCDIVYYCVVDARPWLRDPTPLYRTNVKGVRGVLDVAAKASLRKFVFTSSIATIGIVDHGLADEQTSHNWLNVGGDYVRSRVEAEELVLNYQATQGLPAVAMCVANTYGSGDYLPTPHGGLVAAAVTGRMPFYIKGAEAEVVGVEDAARAMILAGQRGRPGERYIVSERCMTADEIYHAACAAVGVDPPRLGVPIKAMSALGVVSSILARVRHRDTRLSPLTVRLMHVMSPMNHDKAVRELGWQPRPTTDAIAEAAIFFRTIRCTRIKEKS